jgi:hypothetical protein
VPQGKIELVRKSRILDENNLTGHAKEGYFVLGNAECRQGEENDVHFQEGKGTICDIASRTETHGVELA